MEGGKSCWDEPNPPPRAAPTYCFPCPCEASAGAAVALIALPLQVLSDRPGSSYPTLAHTACGQAGTS